MDLAWLPQAKVAYQAADGEQQVRDVHKHSYDRAGVTVVMLAMERGAHCGKTLLP